MTTFQPWQFTGYLENPNLSFKQFLDGWVFWYVNTDENGVWKELSQMIEFPTENEVKEKIKIVMEVVTSRFRIIGHMVQFWGMKEEGCCLTTVDQPFAVSGLLYKGYCWYRKFCETHKYSLNDQQEVGAVGRAYNNRNPESTPDLRLYSIQDFPLRNQAAQCGLRTYLAFPVFDLHTQKCYGVLEIVSSQIHQYEIFGKIEIESSEIHEYKLFSAVDEGLKEAGLRSTHIGFTSMLRQPATDDEIAKMMNSALKIVPQLHLVQLWSPCKQCVNVTNNFSCMQRVASIISNNRYSGIVLYSLACKFHQLQIEKWLGGPPMSADRKSCFCRNICDFSIYENPLAHYAQGARLSFCFVVLLQNVHCSDNNYLVEFFFQSNSTEVASFLHLLLKIMEMELTNFKFEKSIVELRKTSAPYKYEYVEWKHQDSHAEEINMLTVMKGHGEMYSLPNFKKYFHKNDISCLQPYEKHKQGWLFGREEMSNNNGVNNNTALQENIKKLMTEMANTLLWRPFWLVQFWAVGMAEERPCLQTSDQPFALSDLHKGLAFFRKQSMEHHYFVDEEAEYGPLQRVFRSGHPEISPDLRLYSTTEFPLRDHALRFHLRKYVAFPILDQHKKCIGVLEYVEIYDDDDCIYDEFGMIGSIQKALKATSLCSTHMNFMANPTRQADGSRSQALNEIRMALKVIQDIPQLFHADAWVAYNECDGISGNISCMELFQSSNVYDIFGLTRIKFRPVQTGKGIAGMVLASENKLCFCRNLCNFRIADEPLALYYQRRRLDVCFAICLHSSHTGDLQYVLEFFLYQCPAKYDEYLSSFLHILLPLLKQQLTSFKVASGQQLGDDLVVDVIEFSQGNQTTSSELDTSYSSPFKFRTVFYGQKEPQHSNNELPHSVPDVMDSVPTVLPEKPSNAATSDSREKGVAKEKVGRKRNGSLHIRLEDLQPHFGKKIEHVAQELGVARSTIKRACRFHGIDRWPSSQKYIKNRRLFEAAGTSDDNRSTNIPPSDMSLFPTNDKTSLPPVCDLQPDSETVMVKAKYKDKIIKFELRRLSSSMNDLLQQVGRRLYLEIGSFELRYLDEENDNILLACDDDLQLYFKSLTAGDKAIVQVFDQSIPKQHEIELMAQRKKSNELHERIQRKEEQVFKNKEHKTKVKKLGNCIEKIQCSIVDGIPDHASIGVKMVDNDDDVMIVDEKMGLDNDESLKGKAVALTLESRTDIIAYGTIITVYDHGNKIPKNCMRVAIEKVVDGSARLPIPTDNCKTINDAIGSHVAWPMHLMKLHVQIATKNKKKCKTKNPSLDPSTVPQNLYMVYCYCKIKITDGLIEFPLDNDVFGHERFLHINLEDILPFCRLEPISYTCIVVYMWYLYRKLKDDKFKFVDPYGVAYIPSTRNDKSFEDNQITKRAWSLVERLVGTRANQLLLVPCNVKEHWILTVINPHKSEICLLDSLFSDHNTPWKLVVEQSLNMFNASIGRRGKTIKWNLIKAPKQPDAFQCGFYVLRYMSEIVKFQGNVETSSMQSMFMQKSYSKSEIDEVREEWASCVQAYIRE